MSKKTTNQSSERLFNISKEYKKYYKLGHSTPSKDAGIPVYSTVTQAYKKTGAVPTKVLSANFF